MSRAAAFCEKFDYPEELAELLGEVARAAEDLLQPLAGIVLTPSVSSGDFLWRRSDGRVEFLSDLDGFVFSDASAETIAQFRDSLARIAAGRGGPAFEIDLSVNRISQLGKMPNAFQMVETHLAGFELLGEGLLEKFPSEFDPRVSRQALLLNLFKPLAAQSEEQWAQSAARLLLDVPLIATSEEGICRPGHRARASWFLEEDTSRFAASQTLRQGVEAALAARLDPPGNAAALHAFLVPAMEALLPLIDGEGLFPSSPNLALVERLSSWLPPLPVRRRLGELRSCLRRRTSLSADYTWWRARKEALGGAALWGLLQIAYAQRPLERSTSEILGLFARQSPLEIDRLDFVERACNQYRAGFFELYPSRNRQ